MAMASNEPTRSKMAQLRMACEQEIRACRERYGLLATSIRESIKSIKALVENAQINRGNLAKLKDHLKELEDSFRYALKVNASKDAKHTSISEAISAMVVRIEHLKKTVDDQRAKKDEYEAVLSRQLLDTHSNAMSAPPSNSMDSQTEMSIENNRSLQSKKHQAGCLHDVVPTSTAILTPQSVSTFRRSPRFLAKKLP
ncbi:uncharacterized protein LOC110038549 [Phalaenopsis equestris]|uniref:uncharacterized protein LOC110038549 n=1 Tax=Phalaenopsis equestris TaxID=78828 RepID=UPI0009E3C2D3|nr:uncharacterized protein LOC110038549 [Phalaenopsis equestris]XP_020599080.1 uncharacterized protein LOC110038549 [Phalaenopsis equestris]